MKTTKNTIPVDSRVWLSIPEVAWILGVDESRVCQLIRVGVLPVAKRRSRMVVPAHALAHLAVADNGTPDPLTGGRP